MASPAAPGWETYASSQFSRVTVPVTLKKRAKETSMTAFSGTGWRWGRRDGDGEEGISVQSVAEQHPLPENRNAGRFQLLAAMLPSACHAHGAYSLFFRLVLECSFTQVNYAIIITTNIVSFGNPHLTSLSIA